MILHTENIEPMDKPETMVLIHGMGSASSAWKLIQNQLSASFNVVKVDLPGHGKTPKDPEQKMDPESLAQAVFETLDRLGIKKFHLVGNSLGGWISLEMAAMNPNAVISVTALAPAGLWLEPFTTRYPNGTIARMMANSLRVVSPLLLHYEWARKIGFENVSPRWRDFSYELCLDASNAMSSAVGYYPAWDALLRKRFDKEISPEVKIAVIFGDSDKTLPPLTCQERSLAPSHAKWLNFSECGHAPMWDYPHEVLREIFNNSGIVS